VAFGLSFNYNLQTRGATKKSKTLGESLIRTNCNDFCKVSVTYYIAANAVPRWYILFEKRITKQLQATMFQGVVFIETWYHAQ